MAISKTKILCIDDDPELLYITTKILRREGYEVSEASTGNECLGIAHKEHPDLILLDVNLPDINGIEVCKQIKADPALAGTYVILISGTETASDRQVDGLEAGADGYIVRPIESKELLARVRADIRTRNAEKALRESEERLRFLLKATPSVIYTCKWGPPYGATFISENVGSQSGYKPEEFTENFDFWADHIHPEDAPRIFAELPKLLESGYHQQEYRFLHKDGGFRWMHDEMNLIRGTDGKPVEMVGCRIDITERKRLEETQLFLLQRGSGPSGEDLFKSLARYLAQSLEMDFVCINRLLGDGLGLRTMAVFHNGKFEDNMEYALKDTPCGEVVGKGICCFPRDVRRLFPRDAVLQEIMAESYVGTTLWSFDGKPIGLIAVISRKPLLNSGLAEAVLKLVAMRAAGELERRESEELLRESEERHRTIIQTAMDGFWLADKQGRLLEVNEAYCRMSGYSAQELLAMRIPELEAVESADDTAAHIQKIMAQGEDRFESRHRRKDGSIFDIEVSVRYRSDEGGRFMGFSRDITRRKMAEDGLNKYRTQLESMVEDRTRDLEKAIAKLNTEVHERKLAEDTIRTNSALIRGVFESIQDGVFVADNNQTIIMANRAMERIFCNEGNTELKMKKCFEVLRQATGRCDNCLASRAITEKTTQVDTICCKMNGAGEVWLEVYTYPLFDDEGAVTGVIHYLRDITEKRMLEERARRNDHLAALGQISVGIAHEINNPNHIIMGNSELLKDIWNDVDSILSEHQALHGEFPLGRLPFSEMRERVAHMINFILRGSRRINEIVDGMKQYTSHMQLGHTEKVLVNDVVRACIDMLNEQIGKTTDAFSVVLGEELPPVMGNSQALEEVITNLVSNAQQALTDRTQGISVITRHDRNDNSVILEVRDEGRGMSADVLRMATSPFYTTRQKSGGTGLGLSITLAIVKNHNGSLDIESKPGQGTVATVRLPVGY